MKACQAVAFALLVGCILSGCGSSEDEAIKNLRERATQQLTETSNKCSSDMNPVLVQLQALTAEQRRAAKITPDDAARVLLPCQRDVWSFACAEAQGALAERVDTINGTSYAASVLMDCTQRVKAYQTAQDVLLIH